MCCCLVVGVCCFLLFVVRSLSPFGVGVVCRCLLLFVVDVVGCCCLLLLSRVACCCWCLLLFVIACGLLPSVCLFVVDVDDHVVLRCLVLFCVGDVFL